MKKVAVIGAGCSGLAAIKCCLDEGLEPVCFERENDIGGLWNYNDNPKIGKGSVYRSCVMNTSKEMMAFSDFPPPKDFPIFLPHRYVNKYFNLYAENFGLRKYINFQTSVTSIVPASDYDTSGSWDITYCKCGFEPKTETFEGVLICTGHHTYPNTPVMEGLDKFEGKTMHSHSYRNNRDMFGKNVLVIGIGNSGADIAVDMSHSASQVYLSTRRGAWVINRKGFRGLPADAMANSRFVFMLPRSTLQWGVEKMSQLNFDHEAYGLKPNNGALESHPTINDELPLRLLTGAVKIKPNVHQFNKSRVSFQDGSSEEIDQVVFATGYHYKIPILDESITKTEDNETCLYKLMYPPNLKHPSLAIVGLVQAIGAVVPISEMQCRWFTRTLKGHCSLPSKDVMMEEIRERRQTVSDTYYPSKRHTIQTFWIDYMDDIAREIGVRPNFYRMFGEDPKLALQCVFGPCLPAQYRLEGPGKWNGAKASIQNAMSRYGAPLQANVKPKNHNSYALSCRLFPLKFSVSFPAYFRSYFAVFFVVALLFCMCFVM